MNDPLSELIAAARAGDESALSALARELAELDLPNPGEDIGSRFKLLQVRRSGVEEMQKVFAERIFKARCAEIFEAYPNLESFSWRQFAPSWSEEDETGLSRAHLREMVVEGHGVDHTRHEIMVMLRSIGDRILLDLFGNSQEISVTREGVTKEFHWAEDDF